MNILEARRRTLAAEVYKKTAEGNPVSVRSLARMRPGLSVMGKSTQKTTTGAQLIPFEVGQQIVSKNGYVRCIPQEDGFYIEAEAGVTSVEYEDIYFVGTNNSSQEVGYKEYENLPAGDYRAAISTADFRFYVVVWRNGSKIIFDSADSSLNKGFTVQEGDKFRIFIRADSPATGVVQAIISKQNSELMYEPYTGGAPSPNPDYPQEIENAGDDGGIDVDVTGANLFDKSILLDYDSAVGVAYFPIKVDKEMDYTLSSPDYPVPVDQYNTTNIFLLPGNVTSGASSAINGVWKDNPITAYGMNGYITVAYRNGAIGSNLNDPMNYNFMLNKGSTALPWEPYKQPQSLTVQTPNGLPGIPVTSGGNYTDEDGQQWICDEIDFKRGKYVKRIDRKTFNATDVRSYSESEQYGPYVVLYTLGKYTNSEVSIMSDKFIPVSFENRIKYINAFRTYVDDSGFCNLSFPVGTVISNLNEAKNLVNDISPKCIVVLKNPIETDLSQEQLSAYVNLHTNRPTTVVSATDDAGIKLTYKTKKSLEVT